MHESLHFNAVGKPFGSRLEEGVTETAARHLVLEYELLDAGKVNRAGAYLDEMKGVEFVLEGIVERTARSRDEALDVLLEAYLTGRQDEMEKIFGAEAWERVLKLSGTRDGWQTHKIEKAPGRRPA